MTSACPAAADADFSTRLAEGARRFGVPGACAAVSVDGAATSAAVGLTNTETGVEVTADTVFQLGSTTKMMHATAVMRLIDAGRLTLDTRIVDVLPEFTTAEPDLVRQVTVQHLLSNTSGIEGDLFADFGRGDDAIARYVASLTRLGHLHAPGAMMSYCNAGWVVLGRMVEVVTGLPWAAAIARLVLRPAGMTGMVTQREDLLRHRCAIGHAPQSEGGSPVPVDRPFLAIAMAPAGSTLMGSVDDLIAFAHLHLNDGVAVTGERLLRAETCRLMRERHVELPPGQAIGGWGLGVHLQTWSGRTVFGHHGGGAGQQCFFDLFAGKRRIVAVMFANGGDGRALYDQVVAPLLQEAAGAMPPPAPSSNGEASFDLAPYAGVYETCATRYTITRGRDGDLRLVTHDRTGLFSQDNVDSPAIRLAPVNRTSFIRCAEQGDAGSALSFLDFDAAGRPEFVFSGVRAARRRS